MCHGCYPTHPKWPIVTCEGREGNILLVDVTIEVVPYASATITIQSYSPSVVASVAIAVTIG